jgi:diguanylate cyclase
VAVARDVTEHKQLLEQLQRVAFYDQLTNLPNRALFEDRLHRSLAWARRENSELALCFVDLDKFKSINDCYGHAAGDSLLKLVAQRLQLAVRETDTVARLGGDEFVIVMDAVTDRSSVLSLLQMLLYKLEQPFTFGSHSLVSTASIGVAFFPEHGQDQDSLLAKADMAMYRAKQAGGNQFKTALHSVTNQGKNYG